MLRICITNDQQHDEISHPRGVLEFGRSRGEKHDRFVLHDRYVSRRQMRVEEVGLRTIRVENVGSTTIHLPEGQALRSGETGTYTLPAKFTVGVTQIEVSVGSAEGDAGTLLRSLALPAGFHQTPFRPLQSLGESPSTETLARWFQTLLSVQKAAAGSSEFYNDTARAVVELIGLDCGMVVLREEGNWRIIASHHPQAEAPIRFSHTVLTRVLEQKRTFYDATLNPRAEASLTNIEAYVASPIFDARERVIGAIFGSRSIHSASVRHGIAPLEAQMVQLLAGVVSVGLARLEREAAATRLQVQLEQFASPEVARALQRDPNLLEPRHREITVLFADVRGFSSFAEHLSAGDTYRLVRDVMDSFTNRIVEHGGFIIHYAGDGIAAMWNAPTDQRDHALRACNAALALHRELPGLNETWRPVLGRPLYIGVGIHTGMASVGNSGSRSRLKYGALGHTVNLASRIEGATKYLGIPVLMTSATRAQIQTNLPTRRLCRVQVVGLENPVELHELHTGSADEQWVAQRDLFEQALSLCESSRLSDAEAALDRLTRSGLAEVDPATRWLIQWVRSNDHPTHDPVLHLGSK